MRLDIKQKMAEKGLNRNQLAKLMRIGFPAACALYEGKTKRISFDILEEICRVLECTPNDILVSDNPQIQRLLGYYLKTKELQNKNDTDS